MTIRGNPHYMEHNSISKRKLLILGNGFDLDLGRSTRFSDFAQSEFWPQKLKSNLFEFLDKKAKIKRWLDLEGELAKYVATLNNPHLTAYSNAISRIAEEDEYDFNIIVSSMIKFLSGIEKMPVLDSSLALKVFSLICQDMAFQKVYSFNYTNLNKLSNCLGLERTPVFEYVHGCLVDKSAILGINDAIDTIDGYYDFLRKSFNAHYASHPVSYDLSDADEVVFFGHSLGENDYHYFQSFFRHQCRENMTREEKRDITIFTYNDKSRMEIMHTLHKMNDGRTSLLFQNNNLHIFCTKSEEKTESQAFRQWCFGIEKEIERLNSRIFFDGIT